MRGRRAKYLGDDGVGESLLHAEGTPDEDEMATIDRLGNHLVEDTGLAHPRGPDHGQELAPTVDTCVECNPETLELVDPVDQVGWNLSSHGGLHLDSSWHSRSRRQVFVQDRLVELGRLL
jgi:hypothetical protein